MIPKARILDIAKEQELQPTTIEKDYVLGWLLFGIARHPILFAWLFKGGTCLKKCLFDTYRFSEDLDFTVVADLGFDRATVHRALEEIADWIESQTGLKFPRERLEVVESENKRGKKTLQGKLTYVGPLNLPSQQLQRVKLDLTDDEIVGDTPARRPVFHPYGDSPTPSNDVLCYSLSEIIAEKTRALLERSGRCRDIYDLVHLNRAFHDEIDRAKTANVFVRKCAFKGLSSPTAASIMNAVDADVLRANWKPQLGHQLPVLPPVEDFLDGTKEALEWLLLPDKKETVLPVASLRSTELPVPRQLFPPAHVGRLTSVGRGATMAKGFTGWASAMERIRYAARNHLCVELTYHGVRRVVEPYSLRQPRTGNLLLYAIELQRGGVASDELKAYKVNEIAGASVTAHPFAPRYIVEL